MLTRSDFGIITGETPPDTASNDLNTVVTVPDGSTIILGGMLRLNQTKAGTKVPILGDIPLLEALYDVGSGWQPANRRSRRTCSTRSSANTRSSSAC